MTINLLIEELLNTDRIEKLAEKFVKKHIDDGADRIHSVEGGYDINIRFAHGLENSNIYYNNKLKQIIINIDIDKDRDEEDLIQDLLHELIHLFDYLKIIRKNKTILAKKYRGDSNLVPYLLDSFEFNVMINTLAIGKKLYEKEYDSFTAIEDILDFYFKIVHAAGIDFDHPEVKQLFNNTYFRKKLITRLNREGLLPKRFKE